MIFQTYNLTVKQELRTDIFDRTPSVAGSLLNQEGNVKNI